MTKGALAVAKKAAAAARAAAAAATAAKKKKAAAVSSSGSDGADELVEDSDKGTELGSDDQTTVTDHSRKVKKKTPRKSAVIPRCDFAVKAKVITSSVLVQAQPSEEVDATQGQWQWFVDKGNKSIVQRRILP